ncbi:MAG: sulfite reductase subunit alpha [Steroidobacteraceae bacterium]
MNTQPANLLLAATALGLYAVMCLVILRGTIAKRRALAHLAHTPAGTIAQVLVVHASQTGTAEGLAVHTADSLQAAGLVVTLHSLKDVDRDTLLATPEVLFLVSTYGEGDPPDAAAAFVATLMRDETLDLSSLKFGLLALGDKTYQNFCGFGRQLEAWLKQRGASPLFDTIELDGMDAHALRTWRHELSHLAATSDLPEWQDLPYETWKLQKRVHLNPGSQGAPAFHLELSRENLTADAWEAGDLLQLQIPSEPDRPRDYSIASIPADGAVHLLVRQQRREDGSFGLGSGFLTSTLGEGSTLQARLRRHSQFRIGGNTDRDLILIGNGTGLAGLRAHLKQRELASSTGAPSHRHWLLFGERQSAYDALHGAELQTWHASGLLTRLDLVYSRDDATHRYVQDKLREEGSRLREWIDAGAALCVCGSLEGMAEGVAEVLREQLGDEGVEKLQIEGRYLRDVY